MTTREILVGALERVRKRWITKLPAINDAGISIFADSRTACGWCALGAIWGAAGSADIPETKAAERMLSSIIDGRSIAAWNDAPGRTQAEVIEAFDKAIAACGEEQ